MNVYDRAGQYGWYGLLEGTDRQGNSNTFFVDSNGGRAANSGAAGQGDSWEQPFATVNFAISQCTNEGNNVIFVASNHAETINDTSPTSSSGSTLGVFCVDKAGVSIIGLGVGAARPTFTLATATDATLEIRSADVTLKNLIVVSAVIDAAVGITVANATDGTLIENCDIRDGGTNVLEVVLGISISANSDDVTIRGCNFLTTPTNSGVLSAIKTVGAAARLSIYDNTFVGDWNAQVMDLDAGKVTNLVVRDNLINDVDAAVAEVIDTHATSTGIITGNTIHVGLPGAGTITAVACLIGPNSITYDEGTAGGLSDMTPRSGRVSKTYTNWTGAPTQHTLFNVAGGPIRIKHIMGVVVGTIKSASIDMALEAIPTAPGTDVELASILAIDADAIGTTYTLNATAAGILVETTNGAVPDPGWDDIIMPIGAIVMECTGAEDGGGAITWYMEYEALGPASLVTAAPTD